MGVSAEPRPSRWAYPQASQWRSFHGSQSAWSFKTRR